MKRLTNSNDISGAGRELAALLDAHGEWFCAERRGGTSVPLRKGEWELSASHGRLHFAYWTERGLRTWRLLAWAWQDERLRMDVTRRMGAERATLELVPRASARAGVEAVRAARLRLCTQLAQLVCAELPGAQVERVRLSMGARRTEPGRYARIILRTRNELLAISGPVVTTGAGDVDALLTSALLWWLRLQRQARFAGLRKLWLVVPHELTEATTQRLALLRADVRRDISLYERDEAWQTLTAVNGPDLAQLCAAPPRSLKAPRIDLSETAARIVAFAPDAIDAVRARYGETLRYRGLAFARVRRTLGREHVWFGTSARRLLTAESWPELAKLLDELATHRCADAHDHRHALYRAAPEAWLESLLRRDITQLDPGLILAPLHAQFRVVAQARGGARPVDLLALRRDGRLAVIELKVSEDAALPLQGADYWRRVEAHRRAGHITNARLFGELEIADEPPLVYLVAPLFRFHRAFQTLARMLTPELDTYRFDLNEDWRAGVHVVRRTRAN
ncbi:MAG: hypothetical protein ACJ74W_03275 [Pyrinomonadaceae bacterium]